MDPAGDALTDILAVGIEIDAARLLQRLQRRDRRHQLHAVVGGVRLKALQFLLGFAEFQDRTPAARAGIAGTGAVGMDGDCGPAHATSPDCSTPYSPILFTLCWKRSLRTYSSGSFGRTSAPGGTLNQSTSRVSKIRKLAPRASSGSASCSASESFRSRR